MRRVLRRAWPALFGVVLLAAAACGPRDSIPKRLQARLRSIAAGRPDLSRDEVQQALARQVRVELRWEPGISGINGCRRPDLPGIR